jgi:hypothetical protein
VSLKPTEEYAFKTGKRKRPTAGIIDIGAYEYDESN